jgi:hypothetical protein
MNDVCSKIRQMKVTDLETFIYADDIMVSGGNVTPGKKKARITACR